VRFFSGCPRPVVFDISHPVSHRLADMAFFSAAALSELFDFRTDFWLYVLRLGPGLSFVINMRSPRIALSHTGPWIIFMESRSSPLGSLGCFLGGKFNL